MRINDELIEILDRFEDTIIVSDNYRENIAYITKRYGISKWSKMGVYSYAYKMFKSNPSFFTRMLNENNWLKEKEIVLIDDDIRNIKSAEKNGIQGIWFRNNDQLKKELVEINTRPSQLQILDFDKKDLFSRVMS